MPLPLTKQLMHVCPACGGRGAVPSYETTARRAIREVWARGRAHPQGALLVEAAPPVAGWLNTIGAPEGMEVYAAADARLPESEYRISPAGHPLPDGARRLK